MSLRLTREQLEMYHRRTGRVLPRQLAPGRPALDHRPVEAAEDKTEDKTGHARKLAALMGLEPEHVQRYRIRPVSAPRQVRRDAWKPTKHVQRYRAYCDELRRLGARVPDSGAFLLFAIPMPKSWPKYKRRALERTPHTAKPDTDNLAKALIDALRGKRGRGQDDQVIARIYAEKYWTADPIGEVLILPLPDTFVSPLAAIWKEPETTTERKNR